MLWNSCIVNRQNCLWGIWKIRITKAILKAAFFNLGAVATWGAFWVLLGVPWQNLLKMAQNCPKTVNKAAAGGSGLAFFFSGNTKPQVFSVHHYNLGHRVGQVPASLQPMTSWVDRRTLGTYGRSCFLLTCLFLPELGSMYVDVCRCCSDM